MELQTDFSQTRLPVNLDTLQLDTIRRVHVLRDDLLPGGSKQRAVVPLLRDLKKQGIKKVVYASPFAGFAQVALAQACRETGITCKIFAEFDPTQELKHLHAYSKLAQSFGADVEVTDSLPEAEERAIYISRHESYEKIPLGFQCESFQKHFQHALTEVLAEVHHRLQNKPRRLWLPLGSGTLTRTILKIIPPHTELHCVDVHVLDDDDKRISQLKAHPQVTYHSAEELFKEQSRTMPPLPSNLHYDAKLWQFIKAKGHDQDLWWNVAR